MAMNNTFLSRLWIGSPLFFSLLSLVFFAADPMGSRGLIFIAALFGLTGITVLIIRWKKIGRIHATLSIILFIMLVLVGVPNW